MKSDLVLKKICNLLFTNSTLLPKLKLVKIWPQTNFQLVNSPELQVLVNCVN